MSITYSWPTSIPPDSVVGPMPFSFKLFLSDFIYSHDLQRLQANSSLFISDLQFPISTVFWASTYGVSTGILQNSSLSPKKLIGPKLNKSLSLIPLALVNIHPPNDLIFLIFANLN